MSELITPRQSSYAEKLRSPRWQRKRTEIMQRDGWRCCSCGDTEHTLNVHHRFYRKGKDPWDYPNYALLTLCEPCHEKNKDEIEANHLIEHAFLFGFGAGAVNDLLVEMSFRDLTIESLLDFVTALPHDSAERTLRTLQRAFLDPDSPQRERIVSMVKGGDE